ncbi:MAG: hypothetical protein H6729_04655 [Deltaproteobacteria bacterium]|nr:hypothetical protein [Deltaproteobacteria bacterium]
MRILDWRKVARGLLDQVENALCYDIGGLRCRTQVLAEQPFCRPLGLDHGFEDQSRKCWSTLLLCGLPELGHDFFPRVFSVGDREHPLGMVFEASGDVMELLIAMT